MCSIKMGLAWGEVKPDAWNSAAPWSYRDSSPYQNQLKVLYLALEAKFTLVINMTTVNACAKPGELFDDYFARKLQVFNTHSGNELPADMTMDSVWERQLIQILVNDLSPDITALLDGKVLG